MEENTQAAAPKKKVAIYTTQTCGYCRMAKDYFKEHGIEYSEFDVGTDLEKRKEMIERSGQMGVPVITIDNDFVVGFNKPKLGELLGIAN
ncbi:MAG TPA: glutaredoxin domain-containing protein [Candidatus Paceibacterota bacterium]|nr:glutaredoxin domain-containing protein [Candidatus Paceibacterota bacterium]